MTTSPGTTRASGATTAGAGPSTRSLPPISGERMAGSGPGAGPASRGATPGTSATTPSWRSYAERVLLTALTFAEVVLIVVAVGLASVLYSGYFAGPRYLPPVLGAAVVGALSVVLATARRWTWPVTAAVSVGGFLLYAAYAVLTPTLRFGLPSLDSVTALGDGLRSGWLRMLTVALPADASPDLLFVPALLAWTAAAVATALTLRSRVALGPLLPPVLAFAAALLIASPRLRNSLALTVAFCGCLLLLALVRSNRSAAHREQVAPELAEGSAQAVGLDVARQRWRSSIARLAFGIPVLAAVLAVAAIATSVLPLADGSDRFDPRSIVEQPVQLTTSVTPLAQLKPQLEEPGAELFTVAVTGQTNVVDRVRVAALNRFDGAVWSNDGSYLVAGETLPDAPDDAAVASRVTLDVETRGLARPFLPVAGRPLRLTSESSAGFAVDPASGDLVTTSDQSQLRYSIEADVPRDDEGLERALPSRTPADLADTALPAPPAWVADVARARYTPNAYPYRVLLNLEEKMRKLRYDEGARPGHSYGAVFRLLVGREEERVGYAEQMASAFVLIARAWGMPARVAVGYRLRPENLRDGAYTVTSGDAHAWPEVHLAGYGWVPFEPTNTGNAQASKPPRERPPNLGQNPDVAPGTQGPVQPQGGLGGDEGAGGRGAVRTTLLVAALVLGGVVLLLAAVVLAKLGRRRRRQRRGTPTQRIVAAWTETSDRLRESGVDTGDSRTPSEIATAAEQELGRTSTLPVSKLAPKVTSALYAPQEPAESDVRAAWALEAEHRRLAFASPAVRLRRLLDPRPLLPRHPGLARWRLRNRQMAARPA